MQPGLSCDIQLRVVGITVKCVSVNRAFNQAWLHHLAAHCMQTNIILPWSVSSAIRHVIAWRLTTGSEVSLSVDQLSGTATYLTLLNFGHLTSRWTFSKPDWRHYWLSAFGVFYSNFALDKCP